MNDLTKNYGKDFVGSIAYTLGDNTNCQQTSRRQAQNYIESGAGLGYEDADNWTTIEAQLITTKGVLGTLMAANAVLTFDDNKSESATMVKLG